MTGFYGLVYAAGVLGILLLFASRWPLFRWLHRLMFSNDEGMFITVFIAAFLWPVFIPVLTSKKGL